MKKFGLMLLAAAMAFGFAGCGPSDEEIVSGLGEKFIVALLRSDRETAKQICNSTGYETFKSVSGMLTLGYVGMNSQIDEAALAARVNTVSVKMLSDKKAVARVYADGDKPAYFNVPMEKNDKGEWKVAATKQSLQ